MAVRCSLDVASLMSNEGTELEPVCSIEHLEFHEQYLSKYIQLADAKAGAAAAALAAVLGALLTWEPWLQTLVSPSLTQDFGVTVLSALFLTGGAAMTFLVIIPRGPRGGEGLIAWDAVAAMTEEDFERAIREAGAAGLARERLGHCHALARVCRQKYRSLRWGLWSGGVGLALGLIVRLTL